MPRIDLKDATIKLIDGTAITPNELEINIGEGNLVFSEHKPRKFHLSRGRLDGVRDEDEVPMDLSLDFVWEEYLAVVGQDVSPLDFLKQAGDASAFVSTNPDPCQPYCVDVELLYAPACTTYHNQKLVFPMWYYEDVDGDPDEATFSVSGRCFALEPTVTRIAP